MLARAIGLIRAGNTALLELLLMKTDIAVFTKRTTDGSTLLHEAARYGQEQATDLLLDCGVHVDILDKNGNTAMHIAAQVGNLRIVCLLAQRKSRAILDAIANIFGDTVMHAATHANCNGLLEFLSKDFPGLRQMNAQGFAPIHCAVRQAVVDNLLAFAKIDATLLELRDAHGLTPLHHAAICDSKPMIQAILSVDDKTLDFTDNFFYLPVHSAALHGNLKAFVAICEHCTRMLKITCTADLLTPLHIASHGGHLDIVMYIAQRDFSALLCTDFLGRTPLYAAIFRGQIDVCRYMITGFPVVVHVHDKEWLTPYSLAFQLKSPYILGLIVLAMF